jgi:diazepam-binding inhibitor (GABA receptor modulating acyl-CoA-binding protein)
MLDLKGKSKWEAWNALKRKSQNNAKKEYVEFVLTLLPDDVKQGYQ